MPRYAAAEKIDEWVDEFGMLTEIWLDRQVSDVFLYQNNNDPEVPVENEFVLTLGEFCRISNRLRTLEVIGG